MMKAGWIQELCSHVCSKSNVPVTLLIIVQLLQLMPDNSQSRTHIPYEIRAPTAFRVPFYFFAMALMSKKFGREKLNIVWNVVNSTLVGMVVHLVNNDWNELNNCYSIGPQRALIQPYVWFNPLVTQLQASSQRSDSLEALKQRERFFKADHHSWDLMEWTPPRKPSQQKSIKQF